MNAQEFTLCGHTPGKRKKPTLPRFFSSKHGSDNCNKKRIFFGWPYGLQSRVRVVSGTLPKSDPAQ